MRLLFYVATAFLLSGSAYAQRPLPFFPEWPDRDPNVPSGRVMNVSEERAFAYSAGATVGLLALGGGLYAIAPPTDPGGSGIGVREVAIFIASGGVVIGPAIGNFTLGATEETARSQYIKAAGLVYGTALAGATVVYVFLEAGPSGPDPDSPILKIGLLTAAGLMVGGLVGGAVYDFATIPRNARRAQRHRGAPRVSASILPIPSQPTATLRVQF